MRVHKSKLPDSPAKPPNALLSRKADGEGVFDFDGILEREDKFQHDFTQASICSNAKHSDVDSFYSDADLDNMSYTNNDDDVADVHPNDDDSVEDDNYSDDDSDFSDGTYVSSDTSQMDDNDDCLIYDFDEDVLSISDYKGNLPNSTPRPFPDEHVPFSENIYQRKSKKQSPGTIAQLQISHLFNRNKASIAMHDELIDIINAYVESVNPSPTTKLLHRRQFLDKMENSFSTSDLKPTY